MSNAARRLVEIRSYALKPGRIEAFHRIFVETVLSMLREAGIDVVAFGKSMHDDNAWYLIRAFDDFAHLNAQENGFYGSDAWKSGPRETIIEAIDRYLDSLIWMSNKSIDEIRQENGANWRDWA